MSEPPVRYRASFVHPKNMRTHNPDTIGMDERFRCALCSPKFKLLGDVRKIVCTVLKKRVYTSEANGRSPRTISLEFAMAGNYMSKFHRYLNREQRELRIWKAERAGAGSTNACVCCAVHQVSADRI